MPTSKASVKTRDFVNSLPYPFFTATAPTKYPIEFNTQKIGIVNIFTINGPITGSVAINAARPANACVNTPKITVPKTTFYVSISYFTAINTIIDIVINITICLP